MIRKGRFRAGIGDSIRLANPLTTMEDEGRQRLVACFYEVLFGDLFGYSTTPIRDGVPPSGARCTGPSAPLLLFVYEGADFVWPIWIPPRVGDDSSIPAQYQKTVIENTAIALRRSEKPASSSNP